MSSRDDRATGLALTLVALLALALVPGAAARHAPSGAAAYLLGQHGERSTDANHDTLGDTLELDVPIRVNTAGTFWVTAILANDANGKESREMNRTVALAIGDTTVRFTWPGEYFHSQRSNATQLLKVTLRKAADNSLLDTNDYRTNAYDWSGWAPAPVRVTRAPTLHFADSNGDGRSDELRLGALVEAAKPGSYEIKTCLTETRTAKTLPCPGNRTFAATKGPNVLDFPLSNGSAYTGEYAATIELWSNGTYLDTLRTTSAAFRMPALAARDLTLSAPTATPASGGTAAGGVRFTLPFATNESRSFELTATLADPTTGTALTATAGPLRLPAGGGDISVTFPGAAAEPLLAKSAKPVAFYQLADGAGLVVAGGRADLPGVPVPSFTMAPLAPIAGDRVALRASGVPTTDAATFSWAFADGATASGATIEREYPDAGTFATTLRIANSLGIYRESTADVAIARDLPPVLKEPPAWSLVELTEGTIDLPLVDPNGRALTVRVVDAPAGMNATGATLRWTPPVDAPRSLTLRLVASDGRLETPFTAALTIANVDTPPRLATVGGPLPAKLDLPALAPWQLPVLGVDDENDRVTVSLASAPDGVTLAEGILAWAAPAPGEHEITMRAEANGKSSDSVIRLVVTALAPTPPTPPPTIPEPPEGTQPSAPTDSRRRVDAPALAPALAIAGALAILARRRLD